MKNFTFSIPTTVHFGQGQIQKLGAEMARRATRVLMVYGGGSIRRNGVYDGAVEQLKSQNLFWTELGGVEPNPRIATVRRGVELCREHNLDGVLALGGGSVIDCAKAIAAGACYDGDPWDFPSGKAKPERALPIFTVLTMAATGSEMDSVAVISNPDTQEKLDFAAACCLPAVSILDPTYTCSLPASQTAAGTADIMSHTFENYFSPIETSFLADSMAEDILRACIHYGPRAIADPNDYEARANLMWCAPWAINGFLDMGKPVAWSVHKIEHELGGMFDVAHGAGLAAVWGSWARYVMHANLPRFTRFAVEVMGCEMNYTNPEETALAGVAAFESFCRSVGMPSNLHELGLGDITEAQMHEMAVKCTQNDTLKIGGLVRLYAADIEKIYAAAK